MKRVMLIAELCALITIGSDLHLTACYEPQVHCMSYVGCVGTSTYMCCSKCWAGYYVFECKCVWDPLHNFQLMGNWCVQGWELGYFDVDLEQCAYMCELMSDCTSFEYANSSLWGGAVEYSETCRPKSGGLYNASECGKNFTNLDHYILTPENFLFAGTTMCGGGHVWLSHSITYDVNLSTNVVVTWDRTINGCATLCDTLGAATCIAFWVYGGFPLYDFCAMWSEIGTNIAGTDTLCYRRHALDTISGSGKDWDNNYDVWLVEDACSSGWFTYMPQYTNGYNLCQYSCDERRRNVNKTVDFPMADNVLAQTMNNTFLEGFMNPSRSGIKSSFTERRLSYTVLFKGLSQLVVYAGDLIGIIDTTLGVDSSDSEFDAYLCTSHAALECVTWATCIACGLLFSIGKNISSMEKCSRTPYNLMETYENTPTCLNRACDLVLEDDSLVYDCATPVFRGCINHYMNEMDRDNSGNGDCCDDCCGDCC